MGFLDLFRPKWRHSDVEVRMEAVRDLDADDLQALGEVVRRDPDARIRRLALKKIDDLALLKEVAQDDRDESLRKAAEEKAVDLLVERASSGRDEAKAQRALEQLSDEKGIAAVARKAAHEAVRLAAVTRLEDARLLGEVARRADDIETRKAALERIGDTAVLRDLALTEEQKALAAGAVARIDDPEVLAEIAENAKNKAARQAARARLPEAEPARAERPEKSKPANRMSPVERKARKTKLLQLALLAEAHAREEDFDKGARGLVEVRSEWEALDPTHQEKALWGRLQKQFASLEARKGAHQRTLEAKEREAKEREARKREKPASRPDPASAPPVDPAADPAPAAAPAAAADQAPAELSPDASRVPTGFAGHPGAAPAPAGEVLTALAIEAESLNGPERVLKERIAELERRWGDLDDADDVTDARQALRSRFAAACDAVAARLRQAEEEREARRAASRKTLQDALAVVERAIAGDSVKKAENAQKNAQQLLKRQKPTGDPQEKELRQSLTAALEKLVVRMGELRDAESWKRWANQPKLEELCQQAEALAEIVDTVEDKRRVPVVLRELQGHWKEASRGAPSEKTRALWERFKKACDSVYEKGKEYFAKLDEERTANLQKKEALCEKVEALKDSTDWKATAEEIKRLQEEWKGIGPVPQEKGEAVWKRFRAACDAFFERRDAQDKSRDEERQANLEKKVALCARAEALSASTDWKGTAEEIKGLQDEWQEIGPAPRDQADEVWKRFRRACDRFFEARKAAFSAADEEREANLKLKDELCRRAEALVELPDQEEARAQAKALQQEWKKVGHVPREQSDAIWKRFRGACDRVFEKRDDGAEEAEGAALPGATGISGFVNRLPLEQIAEKLRAQDATAKPAQAPAAPTPDPEKPDEKDPMQAIDEGWE